MFRVKPDFCPHRSFAASRAEAWPHQPIARFPGPAGHFSGLDRYSATTDRPNGTSQATQNPLFTQFHSSFSRPVTDIAPQKGHFTQLAMLQMNVKYAVSNGRSDKQQECKGESNGEGRSTCPVS
jgi:hypothetical protein